MYITFVSTFSVRNLLSLYLFGIALLPVNCDLQQSKHHAFSFSTIFSAQCLVDSKQLIFVKGKGGHQVDR